MRTKKAAPGLPTLLALILLAAAAPAELRGQGAFGAQGLWGSDTDFGIGGRLAFNLSDIVPHLEALAAFNLFFPDGPQDFWEINGNILYHIHVEGSPGVLPYFGGGLNVGHLEFDDGDGGDAFVDDDTELGLNVLGGVRFLGDVLSPYLEARGVVSDFDQFVLTFGFLFGDLTP